MGCAQQVRSGNGTASVAKSGVLSHSYPALVLKNGNPDCLVPQLAALQHYNGHVQPAQQATPLGVVEWPLPYRKWDDAQAGGEATYGFPLGRCGGSKQHTKAVDNILRDLVCHMQWSGMHP
jgi:hypothetical protein